MAECYRVCEKFHIKGRSYVYLIYHLKNADIRMGKLLYDFNGNRFKVKGLEMIRAFIDFPHQENDTIGVMFENLDGVEVEGNILVDNLENLNFLFCNHPLYKNKVDEDYVLEYQAAGENHSCALFSYEDMETGKLTMYGDKISGLTIYRGWMMPPKMYRDLYNKLADNDIMLINTPEEYEKYHMLPNWYRDFEENTPKSIWTDNASPKDILQKAKGEEGSFIIKDYVKSRKHEWYDACYIPDICNVNEAEKIISNFANRQGEMLNGGLVLRKYENLNQIGFHEQSGMPISEEYRVFIFCGKVAIIDNYWTDKHNVELSDEEYTWITEIAGKVKGNFVTLDLARKQDGKLIIMEFGDGQVSGLQQIEPEEFYKCFELRK